MNTVLNGADLGLFFVNSGGTKLLIAHSQTHKLDIKHNLREISSKDTGIWKEKASGKMEWTISTDALVTNDLNTFSYEQIYDLMIKRQPLTIYSAVYSGTTMLNGTVAYTGQVYISSLSADYKDSESVTMSISLDGSGPLIKITN